MKAKEVLEKLNITRPTLSKYVQQGIIKVDSQINGQYVYNEASVLALCGQQPALPQSVIPSEIKLSKLSHEKEIVNCLDNIYLILKQLDGNRLLSHDSFLKLNEIKSSLDSIKKVL